MLGFLRKTWSLHFFLTILFSLILCVCDMAQYDRKRLWNVRYADREFLTSTCKEVENILGYSLSDLPLFMLPNEDGGKMWLCPVQPASASSSQLLQLPATSQLEWVIPPPDLRIPGGESAWPSVGWPVISWTPVLIAFCLKRVLRALSITKPGLDYAFQSWTKCHVPACANSLPT